ncbi:MULTISPECIES: RibD family protein [unclassified Prochlorococcus]|uniref:RibD family protein n=1 Tax=unclassified Prochlorococcus TaxID=2627481 RepID=UPI0005338178|nr:MULTISPECIES: RibD family protein [unclassified Prochlorococcus]KGG26279.1 5-amino-6-(5-phosphoribosylamino)uracil reductase [Prochlorococcus sp. MIT 0701]KGG30468.1 5-amino-6-(5-phosphoribosylamino)uracil reductase [Prochlorococcus sp. MIT 0702]KGG33994.1 5-amino-6-(5-phosphoribosylamino)uracil reductase [Prochlorococcus sp. MIT 0703]
MQKQSWLRLVLAISLDGRLAPAIGGPAQLGGVGDRRALEEALAWADGALLGAGTLRAHRSTCLIHDQDLLNQRKFAGHSAQPKAVVVSRQQWYSADAPFFQQPIERWLLSPHLQSAEGSKDPVLAVGYERQVLFEQDWPQTLHRLVELGLSRLVLLGGAQLAASLLKADVVDELQLTLTPKLLGGMHAWVPFQGGGLPEDLGDAEAWHLQTVEPLSGNELLLRYERKRTEDSRADRSV